MIADALVVDSLRGRLKVWYMAGFGLRDKIKFAIIDYCIKHNLTYQYEEEKGFLQSHFVWTMEGLREDILQAQQDFRIWFEEMQS